MPLLAYQANLGDKNHTYSGGLAQAELEPTRTYNYTRKSEVPPATAAASTSPPATA